jgi:hypothetical protein
MSAVVQSLGRIVLVAFVLVVLLALATTARYASTRASRRPPAGSASTLKPVKGDVRRDKDGTLQYFDGRQWSDTPPPPTDDAF